MSWFLPSVLHNDPHNPVSVYWLILSSCCLSLGNCSIVHCSVYFVFLRSCHGKQSSQSSHTSFTSRPRTFLLGHFLSFIYIRTWVLFITIKTCSIWISCIPYISRKWYFILNVSRLVSRFVINDVESGAWWWNVDKFVQYESEEWWGGVWGRISVFSQTDQALQIPNIRVNYKG